MSALDIFRQKLITSSIAAAANRTTRQRRHFATADAADNYQKLAAEHELCVAQLLNNFGCVSAVSTPAILMDGLPRKDGSLPDPIRVSSARVTAAAVASTSSEKVVMGFDDGFVTVWNAQSGAWLVNGADPQGLLGIGAAVRGVSCNRSGTVIVSTHRSGVVAVWNVPQEQQQQQQQQQQPIEITPSLIIPNAHGPAALFPNRAAELHRCAFSPVDDTILATTGDDGCVRIWSLSLAAAGAAAEQKNATATCLMCLCNGPDPAGAATTSSSSPRSPAPATRCVAFHPDGALLLVGDVSGALALWDLRDATRIWTSVGTKPLHTGRINCVAFNSNGFNFYSAGDDGLLFCFDLRRLAPTATATTTTTTATATAASVVSNSLSYVWRQAAHGDAVADVSLVPSPRLGCLGGDFVDCPLVVTGGLDGAVVAWDSWTGEEKWRSEPPPSYVAAPKVATTPAPPAVRSVVVVNSSSSSPSTAESLLLLRLVVMRREAQWRCYETGGALLGEMKQIETTLLQQAKGGIAAAVNNNKNSDAAAAGDETNQNQNNSDDDDDDDDDIMANLRKK